MEIGKKRKRRLLYGLALLLAFMLLFTLIARAASAFTTTRVIMDVPMARRIEHIVSASGVTEKNRELAVLAQENLLVETVYVSQGESVAAGTLLAQLSMDSIEEQIRGQEEELALLRLQLASAQENENQAAQERKKALSRATEDYERICREQEEAVEAARSRCQAAEDALARYRQELEAGGAVPEVGGEGEPPAGGGSAGPEGEPSAGGSGADPGEKQAQLDRLKEDLGQAQAALEAARQNQSEACRSAARSLEDARQQAATDYSARITELSITQKERELAELMQVKEAGGQVLSPVDGVITQIYLAVGQKTTDTAAFTMADLTSGLRYVAKIGKEDAAYVEVGDEVTLKAAGKEIPGLTVFSLEETDEDTVQVTVLVPQGEISMGEYAQMEVVKRSGEYDTTIPLSAIHTENGKKYVYVAEEEETVLGTQLTARKVEVEIVEQNDRYGAVAQGMIGADTPVIVSSDSYLKAGDTIRLQQE